MSNNQTLNPKTAEPVFLPNPYIQTITNRQGLTVGWKAITDEGVFQVRYDIAAPKAYQPPQMLTHVTPFKARAEALGCIEERAFRSLFRTLRAETPDAQRRDVADLLNPVIREAAKNARRLDPEAHDILRDFSFMARNTAYQFLRTTKPGTPERKALTDALTVVPSLPVLVPLPSLPHVRDAIIKGASLKQIIRKHTGLSWKLAQTIDPWAAGLLILNRRTLLHKDGILSRNDVAQHVLNAPLPAQRNVICATIAVANAARQNAHSVPHKAIPWAAKVIREAHDKNMSDRPIMDWAVAAMLDPTGPAGAWEPSITLDGAIRRATDWKAKLDAQPVPDLSWSRPNYAPPDDELGVYTFTFLDTAQGIADAATELGNCARDYTEDAAEGACALYTVHMKNKLVGLLEIVPSAPTDAHAWTCVQAVAKFNKPMSRRSKERLRDYAAKFGGTVDAITGGIDQ